MFCAFHTSNTVKYGSILILYMENIVIFPSAIHKIMADLKLEHKPVMKQVKYWPSTVYTRLTS